MGDLLDGAVESGTLVVQAAHAELAYFEGNDITGPLLVLSAWAVAGAAITVVMAALRKKPERQSSEA